MAFQVELSAQASRDIEETYLWLQERNPTAADRWFNGVMFVAIHTLKDSPLRCSTVPEQDSFTQEIRHLIYQKKYRVIFTVQDETVYILSVRHTARKPLEDDDLENIS